MDAPVVIIGGGPVGLIASIMLSRLGVEHVVLERHPSTSIHPKAVGLNQRTAEIFRSLGVAHEVLAEAAPPQTVGRTSWHTSFGGPTELHGRQVAIRDAWGGGAYAEEYAAASPASYIVIPQIRLEPILLRAARAYPHADVRFGHEVVDVRPDGTVTVRAGGEVSQLRGRYVIAADGGRMAAERLGIASEGPTDLLDMVSAHFSADLSEHVADPGSLISWFINPDFGGSIGSGYLYHIGPWDEQGRSKEWVFACAFAPTDPERFDDAGMIARIGRSLGVDGLDIDVHSISHWYIQARVAQRFREGAVFLAGDAAHRIPPWGALGLNTGIHDAENLTWKLAAALDAPELEPLLDTYEAERRPIALAVAERSLANFQAHGGIVDRALGIDPADDPEVGWASLAQLWQETEAGDARRAALAGAMQTLDEEFHAHGAECGFSYRTGALIAERESAADDGVGSLVYVPSTEPGHHLPHAWVHGPEGTVSTIELGAPGRWLLFVDAEAERWRAALDGCSAVLARGVDVVQVGAGRALDDRTGRWSSLRGVGPEGAILVRPDRFVAWRARTAADAARLGETLRELQATPAAVPVVE